MERTPDHQEYFEEISSEYDSYYAEPETIMDFEKVTRLERALSLATVSSADTILNVGVGAGELNEALSSTHGGDVVGVDFSRPMIELARTGDDPFLQGALQQLPLVDDCVDLAFCLGVLGYLDRSEIGDALSELHRVLAPGGELILTFGNRRSPFRRFRNIYNYRILNAVKRLTGMGNPLIHEYREYDPDRIQRLVADLGLRIEARRYLTYSSGVFDTPVNHRLYRIFENRFEADDRVGWVAMTWLLKLRKN
jgi:ubiquinone/menaquinone biosynthesis C-methylase UbiE